MSQGGQFETTPTNGGADAAPESFTLPWFFDRKRDKHLIIDQPKSMDLGSSVLVNILGQVLSSFEPGRVRLLMIDPLKLGETFVSFLPFGDTNRDLISGGIWQAKEDIRRQMQYLLSRISTVLQKNLRADFDSLDEYNADPGTVVEPYYFVAIAGFPKNFDQESVELLKGILRNGARCGVHVVLTVDRTQNPAPGTDLESFRELAMWIKLDKTGHVKKLDNESVDDGLFLLDPPAERSVLRAIVDRAGKQAQFTELSNVDFEEMIAGVLRAGQSMSRGDEILGNLRGQWTASSAKGLVIPLGKSGMAIKPLILGKKEEATHSAILVGTSGTGKTNTLHVIISGLAQMYSPDEVEMYLLDFRDGVSFDPYSKKSLPHAKAIGLWSDAEIGSIVMRHLKVEMERRNRVFAALGSGIDNIEDFRRTFSSDGKPSRMPLIVLVLDEFQKLFESGSHAKENEALLDTVIRTGRGVGIHVILATQSLYGSGVERVATTANMIPVRMVLRCTERDSKQLLGGHTEGARLPKGGAMLFNDGGGDASYTEQVQVAKFDPRASLTSALEQLRVRANEEYPEANSPLVFKGNEPAQMAAAGFFKSTLLAENAPALSGRTTMAIGIPLAIEPEITISLRQSAGQNVLIVDRRENLAMGVIGSCCLSALSTKPPAEVSIDIVSSSATRSLGSTVEGLLETAFSDRIQSTTLGKYASEADFENGVSNRLVEVLSDIEQRQGGAPKITRLLVLIGLQSMRMFRGGRSLPAKADLGNSSGSAPIAVLHRILNEGPGVGVHSIVWSDTWPNLEQLIDRNRLAAFDLRIVGLIEDRDASALLGPGSQRAEAQNRSSLYNLDAAQRVTQFWPFDVPEPVWLKEYSQLIARKWSP